MDDFMVTGGGSLFTLKPLTPAARQWVDEFIDPNAQHWGGGIVIEHRYIEPIVDAIINDGLSVI